jgi:2'-5' RNA ligase
MSERWSGDRIRPNLLSPNVSQKVSMPPPTRLLFLALDPDPALRDLVAGYKARTRTLVGDQLYLADPPHVTLYLGHFPPGFDPLPLLRHLDRDPAPGVRIVGWHTFLGDPLTGRNTLVCAPHPDDKPGLRDWQRRVIEAVADRRDRAATEARLAPRLDHLTPEQRAAVAAVGFPFVGDGWEPHLTVASIRPENWPAVWADLGPRPPVGEFTFRAVRHYDLLDGAPAAAGEVAFG